ncbi:MAG: MAPEG family protein [Sphingomonadales bacterium]|nr:MAPEG family protein [Sphingomonadales bacterium]
MILPTTLCLAAAAVVLNGWLGMRIGQLRHALKVSVGDGGQDLIMRRMRAQANFIEQAPLTLVLFAAVELAGKGGAWLAPLGAAFIVGRIAHALGMDSDTGFRAGRPIGMLTSYAAQITLAVTAVLTVLGKA